MLFWRESDVCSINWCVTSLNKEKSDCRRICSKRKSVRNTCAKQMGYFSTLPAPRSGKHANCCPFRCVINGVPIMNLTLPYVLGPFVNAEIGFGKGSPGNVSLPLYPLYFLIFFSSKVDDRLSNVRFSNRVRWTHRVT